MKTKTFITSRDNFQEMHADPYCPLITWRFLESGEVEVTVDAEEDECEECEWCGESASFKIQDGDYVRYACGNVYHREELRRLARLDGHKFYDVILF